MQFRLICTLVLLIPVAGKAQFNKSDFNTNFAFSIHSMDEFFDRFNFKPNSGFEKYVRRKFPDAVFTRENLLFNLFNKKNQFFFQDDKVAKFVQQVTDTCNPQFVNYSDKFWYAEIKCRVTYLSKPQTLTLILKVEQPEPDMFLWAVVSARGEFLKTVPLVKQEATKVLTPGIANITASRHFLSPVSHGIDFTNIENVFINRSHVRDYLSKGKQTTELKKLLYLIENNKIKFHHVSSTAYHLLQINGWIVTVNNFNRNTMNSGWLINNLMNVTPEQKALFLRKQLNVII